MYRVKEPDGELVQKAGEELDFESMDDGLMDYITEMLRSEGANSNFISYIMSEIEDLKENDPYPVEFNGRVIFTITRL